MHSGIFFLNKQSGITSFDALRDIKRTLGTGKVGHTGTLDKFAQGLLIVLVGKALRLSQWFTNCDKKYIGKIHFGLETDTLDPEGDIIARAEVPSRDKVESVLNSFTGVILQAPPAYSAIHINGKRASDLSRAGQVPEMKKREVTVYKLELVSWEPPFGEIFVHCSSGTYIRSLARDIALAVESRGYLCALERTQIAGFELGDEKMVEKGSLGDAKNAKEKKSEEERAKDITLLPIDKSVIKKLGMPWYDVSAQEAKDIFHGKPLSPLASSANNAAVFCEDTLIAIIEKKEGKWKYGCVINDTQK